MTEQRTQQSLGLAPNETAAIVSFIDVVNNVIRVHGNPNPISEQTALKFLTSSKFNVERALELYRSHEVTRFREGLSDIDPNDSALLTELESGKFIILAKRSPDNAAIAIFTAKLHAPSKGAGRSNNEPRRKLHRYTLQGIVYQLDAALEDVETQKNGIVFIYNMCNSDYSNFDYELCQKILNLLKGAYPAKLKKVLIVSPPLWFRAPFHLLRLIVREKLRERVWLLSREQLPDHLPIDSLTPELGGSHVHNHREWLDKCNRIHSVKQNDLCNPMAARHIAGTFSQSTNFRRLSMDRLKELSQSANNYRNSNNHKNEVTGTTFPPTITIKTTPAFQHDPSMAAAISAYLNTSGSFGHPDFNAEPETEFDYDDQTGVCLMELADIYRQNSKDKLPKQYEELRQRYHPGSTSMATISYNRMKNRYMNILPYDHSRVVLESDDLPDELANQVDPFDYVNACFIDGYHQRRAYISTQGPLESTAIDFWRMIWQTDSRVIAMFALVFENGCLKCHQYWPTSEEEPMWYGVYKVEFEDADKYEDFTVTRLKLTNTRAHEYRTIWHLQYTSWPDFGTPASAEAILKFREYALKKQLDAIDQCGAHTYPPFVVHCSAGVGRTGTFITIDISIQKLEATGLVDIAGVVDKLRCQRSNSVQTGGQYIFCYKAVLEYAVSCGLLKQDDLGDPSL